MSGKVYCSFCGKDDGAVLCIIAGPAVGICDECVALCNDIVFKHQVTRAVQQLLPAQNIETPPAFRPTSEFIAEVRAKIAAPGTLTEGGDVEQAPGDSLSGPTAESRDAQ